MVLKNNQIPPHLNFINPKPNLNLNERGIKVPLELQSLTPEGHVGPRRVSVSFPEVYIQSIPFNRVPIGKLIWIWRRQCTCNPRGL
jgi:hypothetical protein